MRQGLPVRTKRLLHAQDLLFLVRVMNLGENRIGMRIPRSAWFLRDLRFSHSYAVSNRVHNTLYSVMQWYWTSERSPALCRLAGCCGSLLVLTERRCSRAGPTALTTAIEVEREEEELRMAPTANFSVVDLHRMMRTKGFAEGLTRGLERVMNLGENRIEMRIARSAWFPGDFPFPYS